jgi:HD-GYP domain-containing protein (c-di-GMP phosphodiesterase class II)
VKLPAVSYFLAVLSIILLALFALTIARLRLERKKNLEELEIERKNLSGYLAKIDNLMLTLSNIHEFSIKAAGMSSKEELALFVINSACSLFNAGSGSVMLINPASNMLEIVASKNLSAEVVATTRLRIGEGIAGKVVQTGKPIFVEDITTDPRFVRASNVHYNTKSFVSVSMETKGKAIGVLNISPLNTKNSFEDKSFRFLSILADQSAVGFENISLYNNLNKFYFELVEAMAKTIDVKDSYTHEHGDRAQRMARKTCQEMELPESIVKHIEYAALIHDIGKLAIDNQILSKPGKLSAQERRFIEQHPIIGSQIIEPVTFLSPIAPIVLYHQEWYNGCGYPEGLSGEEIPLGARIVSVIDSFDAMTSDRPYRKAMKRTDAIKELKRASGTQFDPAVVEAFLKALVGETHIEENA